MNSTHSYVAEKISGFAPGTILFLADFRGLGSYSAIKMSLSRHMKSGIIDRLGHGIYLRLKPKGKTRRPTIEEIAFKIAANECIRIRPSGAFALYKVGLEANYPSEVTYITDGEPRSIRIGERTLVFKSATPKKMSLSSGISGLLIQSLEVLGKTAITDAVKATAQKCLRKDSSHNINADMQLAPAWIYDFLYKLNKQIILENQK